MNLSGLVPKPDWFVGFFKPNKPVWGITGGIGAGKSTLARILENRTGAKVLDADKLGHEALLDQEIVQQVKKWGQNAVLDDEGNLNREKISAFIFPNQEKMGEYEAIIHPWIGRRLIQELRKFEEDTLQSHLILDASLLWESGWHRICDLILHLDTPLATKIQRVTESRKWNPEMLILRESLQMPLTLKALLADHCINNSSSLDQLNSQVDALLLRLTPFATLEG